MDETVAATYFGGPLDGQVEERPGDERLREVTAFDGFDGLNAEAATVRTKTGSYRRRPNDGSRRVTYDWQGWQAPPGSSSRDDSSQGLRRATRPTGWPEPPSLSRWKKWTIEAYHNDDAWTLRRKAHPNDRRPGPMNGDLAYRVEAASEDEANMHVAALRKLPNIGVINVQPPDSPADSGQPQ